MYRVCLCVDSEIDTSIYKEGTQGRVCIDIEGEFGWN